jgi:peptide chain release factor
VLRVVERIREEAAGAGFEVKTLDVQPAPRAAAAQSVLLAVFGNAGLDAFVAGWRGTVQWVARSPFRPEHRRKNWFVGVEVLQPVAESHFDRSDVRFETMRASGPGGQHVNRTESAVRVTHVPSGLQATASEERSQHRNRKLALARLAARLEEADAARRGEAETKRWRAHRTLERGNAVRVYREAG